MASSAGDTIRLDRFLCFARIVKTRGQAQAMAESGHVRVDGRAVNKAATPVRIGCVIAFATPGGLVRALRIVALPVRRGPSEEARACYHDLIENARTPAPSVDAASARA
ncbi:RNA-binding S4 domain-containing protein [Sphingomonas sp. MMS24-J45]|uniref:RNA-binding S4 domain-containing protein n=1 Tax=Sphingomonas sp. MMS24-J45 TaxID=3238806 RepID=UPI00384BE44C